MKTADTSSAVLSRRTLLQAGGAMVVVFSLQGGKYARAQAAPKVPLDAWLVIHEDSTASVYMGRTEFGQGTLTGMLLVAAEELDMDLAQVRAIPMETDVTRDQGYQVSSSSIEGAAPNLRAAAAEARQALLAAASKRLGTPVEELDVHAGVVTTRGANPQKVTFGQLIGGKRFDLEVSGTAPLKKSSQYRLIGKPTPRVDIPAKALGEYEYMPFYRVPGMMHGRVVRPAGQGGLTPRARSIDKKSIADIPGVQVVQVADFIGVVAPKEWHAIRAAAALKVDWEIPASLPGDDQLLEKMLAEKTTDSVLHETGNADAAFKASPEQVVASFFSPYESHAPFGPNCAVADVTAERAEVVCSTQNLYPTRALIAKLLGMKPQQVKVKYREGAGTFGHSCYDDAAQAAALMSREVGAPVRVQFSRGQEIGWDNYGPAHASTIRAAAGPDGKLTAYEYAGWQHAWYPSESTAVLAGKDKVTKLWLSKAAVVNRISAGSMYATSNRKILNHDILGVTGYLKGSYLRAPLDLSIVFGSEQVIDELAFRLQMDPVEFRRKNIADPRWLGVLEAVVKASKWQPRVASSGPRAGDWRRGRGVGLGTHFVSYGAAVADIKVNVKTGEIRVLHLYGALDAGLLVNPSSVEQQIEGMMIQATSRMLHEEIKFDTQGVTSVDWSSYPILRFNEAPEVTAIPISRPEHQSTGAGEEALAAAGGAIANAFFDATGKRMHERPFTKERVLKALRQA